MRGNETRIGKDEAVRKMVELGYNANLCPTDCVVRIALPEPYSQKAMDQVGKLLRSIGYRESFGVIFNKEE